MKSYSIINILLYNIIVLFPFINSKYIIIPLTKYIYDIDINENILSKLYSNIYYTKLFIGEPSQPIASFINTSSICNLGIINKFCDKKFYMNNPFINKDYSYKNSSTFYNTKNENLISGTKDISISDQIKFYTNLELTEEIKVENISILYNPNNEGYIIDDVGIDFILEREKKTTCGYIGLQLGQRSNNYNNLLEQLKQKEIISNTIFSFLEVNKENEFYKKNNIDYLLIIGEEIYDLMNIKDIDKYISSKYDKDKIKEKNQLNDYVINEGYYLFVWKMTCSDIFLSINNGKNNFTYLEKIENVYIDQDFGLICGTGEYRDLIEKNFFNEYLALSKCWKHIKKIHKSENSYYIYECDEDINIDKFPKIYFRSNILRYDFSLGKEELFIKDKGKLYFLIIFDLRNMNSWKLGKPFLDKYLFSFNYEAKTFSFYNENLLSNEKNNSNNSNNDTNNHLKIIIIVLIIILSLIALILGFCYGKNIYNKRKKIKAFELDTEQDYFSVEGENKEKNDNTDIFPINE